MEVSALPSRVRGHPLMRLADLSVRQHRPLTERLPTTPAASLLVAESAEGVAVAPGALVYDATNGRFVGPSRALGAPPGQVERVCFLTAPGLVAADAIALHARGVSWRRAVGVWDAAVVADLSADDVALGFVDEVLTRGACASPRLGRPVRALDPTTPAEGALARAIAA